MMGFRAVLRRELAALFHSSLGLLGLVLFYTVAAAVFFFKAPPWNYNAADLNPGFFGYAPIYLLALAPLLALRAWADEYRGAMELLLTLPLRTEEIVLGKFAALTGYLWLLLLTTLPLAGTLSYLGSPDWAAIGAGYLALGMLSALYAAVGLFFSALIENAIGGAIATFAVCFLLYALGLPPWLQTLPPTAAAICSAISVLGPFTEIAAGRLSLVGASYFCTAILFFLALTTLRLQMYKWAQVFSATARRHTLPALGGMLALALAAFGCNLLFRALRYDYLDLTGNRQFTLSPQTTATLQGLSQRILVRAYFSDNPPVEQQMALGYARTLLERYRAAAPELIELQFVDPAGDESLKHLAGNYGIPADIRHSETAGTSTQQLFFRSVQVLCADRAEQFEISLDNPGALEEQLTVAIRSVQAGSRPKVLLYENVAGARDQPDPLGDKLPGPTEALYLALRDGNRYAVDWRDFNQAIPADTQLVILHDPQELPPLRAWQLQEYVRHGGALLICTSAYKAPDFPELRLLQQFMPATAERKTTGLEKLLDGWGLRIQPGLVLERAAHRVVLLPARVEARAPNPAAAYPLLLNLTGSCLNAEAPFTGGFQRLHLNYASPVQVATTPPEGVRYQWLARTTPEIRQLSGEKIEILPWSAALAPEPETEKQRQFLAVIGKGEFPAVLAAPAAAEGGAAVAGALQPGTVAVFGSASLLHESWELRPQGYEPVDASPAKPNGLQLYMLQAINRMAGAQDLLALQAKHNVARPLTAYADLPPEARSAAHQRVAWVVLLTPAGVLSAIGLWRLIGRRRRSSRLGLAAAGGAEIGR